MDGRPAADREKLLNELAYLNAHLEDLKAHVLVEVETARRYPNLDELADLVAGTRSQLAKVVRIVGES